MSTKKNVETDANEKKKYPHVAKRYLKRHYKKVLEIQQKYRDENREKVREWHRTAQQKFYKKNKKDPAYQSRKYYSNQKSMFKKYVFNHAVEEELQYFLDVLEAKKNKKVIKRLLQIPIDDTEIQKMRTIAFRFINKNIEPKDYEQVQSFINEALQALG